MIEQIPGMPPGSLGFRARGTVTADDYESVIVPDIEAAFALNRKLRVLYVLGEDFEDFEGRALWDDAKLGLRHISGWDRVAVVTDVSWLRAAVRAVGAVTPGEFRLFDNAEFAEAMGWIGEPREL